MPGPRGLVQQLDQALHRSELLPRGARLLVAVSGGADSVGLLRLLQAVNQSDFWNWELVVGHVDHGMRAEAGAADAVFVRELAASLGLSCEVRRLGLGTGASEAEARAGRYHALGEMVAAQGCRGVVLAHHADDQAETVLMRIFRGCGIDGLRAMAEETRLGGAEGLSLYRPLLGIRRAELRRYVTEKGQAWREDATNAGSDFLRNRVRAELLPVIEKLWPQGVEAMSRLSRIAAEVQEVMDGEEERLWRASLKISQRGIEFSRAALRAALPAVTAQLLREAVEKVSGSSESADYGRISQAVRLIQGPDGGLEIQMGSGVVVVLEGSSVRVGEGG